jgi:hypothetical protein
MVATCAGATLKGCLCKRPVKYSGDYCGFHKDQKPDPVVIVLPKTYYVDEKGYPEYFRVTIECRNLVFEGYPNMIYIYIDIYYRSFVRCVDNDPTPTWKRSYYPKTFYAICIAEILLLNIDDVLRFPKVFSKYIDIATNLPSVPHLRNYNENLKRLFIPDYIENRTTARRTYIESLLKCTDLGPLIAQHVASFVEIDPIEL